MQAQVQDNAPWYKHFWVWWLIGAKVAVISACVATAILIYNNPTSMVVDDYYNEGRAINLQLNREARAIELGIAFEAFFNGDELAFRFTEFEPEQRTALHVVLYHPTLDAKDIDLRVPHAGDGWYRTTLPREISGHWRIIIEPYDQTWRVAHNFQLPHVDALLLEPVNYGI
ncbi:FixH family protein [Aliidiomarina maris]|uniref:Nitrogen fixation protein FixH n=1 Tax=Aliidiomarina maris TaxID=531312 RepID=A0A327WZE0_9GAMM|nr:FixH family protein [Aliidiomarina maris]RAJ98917.1 hypothetical protein B0I24_104119 [Aliidiomarina maris]RUO25060.1 hypothetical protein CWE07_06170 [Aliidiomarina maris]